MLSERKQNLINSFYESHGDCCAGCDHWRYHNSLIGDCTKSNLVGGNDRLSNIDIKSSSLDIGSGHVITKRDYLCGNFIDTDGAE